VRSATLRWERSFKTLMWGHASGDIPWRTKDTQDAEVPVSMGVWVWICWNISRECVALVLLFIKKMN